MEHTEQTQTIDPLFVDTAVDFIHVYADLTHHGKEEDILFFLASRKYFSEQEDQAMLALFREFDEEMIHEKYKAVVKVFDEIEAADA